MMTITWMDRDYYAVKPIIEGACDGCAFDSDPCGDVRTAHECYEGNGADVPRRDFIFIPATDEALAKYVGWRMNGFVPEPDDNE